MQEMIPPQNRRRQFKMSMKIYIAIGYSLLILAMAFLMVHFHNLIPLIIICGLAFAFFIIPIQDTINYITWDTLDIPEIHECNVVKDPEKIQSDILRPNPFKKKVECNNKLHRYGLRLGDYEFIEVRKSEINNIQLHRQGIEDNLYIDITYDGAIVATVRKEINGNTRKTILTVK